VTAARGAVCEEFSAAADVCCIDWMLRCGVCVVMPLVTVPVLTAQTLLRGLFPAYLGDP